jgi:hypothetical protein
MMWYVEEYEHIPDYLEVVEKPMDFQKLLDNVNLGVYDTVFVLDSLCAEHHALIMLGVYITVDAFLADIELIASNAYLYNPPSGSLHCQRTSN